MSKSSHSKEWHLLHSQASCPEAHPNAAKPPVRPQADPKQIAAADLNQQNGSAATNAYCGRCFESSARETSSGGDTPASIGDITTPTTTPDDGDELPDIAGVANLHPVPA
jgi:hypothetical protein